MMSEKLADHLAYPPRMMRIERAAAYVGMSASTFQKLVDEGVMPQPTRIKSLVAWDRLKLDAACDGFTADADSENSMHALLRRKP
jgi:predicted DNA-binding transcriptional regulator AlpA